MTNAQRACLMRLYQQDTNRLERPSSVRERTMKALLTAGYLSENQGVSLSLTGKALAIAAECHWQRKP